MHEQEVKLEKYVLVYRKDNEIKSIQDVIDTEQILEKIEKFNKSMEMKVELVLLNPLEEWLYNNRDERIKSFRSELADIYHAVQQLDSNLMYLERLCENDEKRNMEGSTGAW